MKKKHKYIIGIIAISITLIGIRNYSSFIKNKITSDNEYQKNRLYSLNFRS